MRLQIDISDTAIEENEELHQLHLWGVQTSLWKNNCIVCGGDTDATRIRCPCGEGVLCSRTCEKHPRAVPLGQCRFMSFNPLKDRPSSNHRRIIIFGSEPPYLTLTWAEVKDSHLIIDHPTFDAYYGGSRTGAFWLDLAVINPAVHTELFRKIGHGIAIGGLPRHCPSPTAPLANQVPVGRFLRGHDGRGHRGRSPMAEYGGQRHLGAGV